MPAGYVTHRRRYTPRPSAVGRADDEVDAIGAVGASGPLRTTVRLGAGATGGVSGVGLEIKSGVPSGTAPIGHGVFALVQDAFVALGKAELGAIERYRDPAVAEVHLGTRAGFREGSVSVQPGARHSAVVVSSSSHPRPGAHSKRAESLFE